MRIAFLHFIKSRSAVQRASQNLQIVNFLKYYKELEYKNLTTFMTYVVEPILSECVKISKLKILPKSRDSTVHLVGVEFPPEYGSRQYLN